MPMTGGLGEAAPRIFEPHREGVARYKLAAAAAPFGQQPIAAQQRAVTDYQQSIVGSTVIFCHWPYRSEAARPFKHALKHRAARRARAAPCSDLSRAGRAAAGRDTHPAAPRY